MKGFKICVLGNPGVGKTSIIKRYETGEFRTDYKLTIGLDIITKKITIEGEEVILSIWDFGGSTKFEKKAEKLFKGMHGCFIVYDITNRRSFEDIPIWLDRIKEHQTIMSDTVVALLVGNKLDLIDSIQVKAEEVKAYIKEIILLGQYNTSAKTGQYIEDAFMVLIKNVYRESGFR
jgi:small GTP-binding protein